jgi:hypothetical protein
MGVMRCSTSNLLQQARDWLQLSHLLAVMKFGMYLFRKMNVLMLIVSNHKIGSALCQISESGRSSRLIASQ